MRALVSLTILLSLLGCGGESNVADCEDGQAGVPCSELTKEEEARQALNGGDYDDAVTLFAELVAEEPQDYRLLPLLAASYAARAGFRILGMVTSSLGASDSLLGLINGFLPDPAQLGDGAYRAAVVDMGGAVAALQAIPESKRAETSGESYAKSATLQLMLYQSAYSVMYLNLFSISSVTGEFDPALLETMTEEDALIIINNLAAAGSLGSDDPTMQEKIQSAVADINGQEGATNRDRLKAFVTKEQAVQP